MTGRARLGTAELPAYLGAAIERYLAFLAAMRAVGCGAPASGPPRFADANDQAELVSAYLADGDARPLVALLEIDLRRLHGDRRVRRRFVSRRWRAIGRAAMFAANRARQVAGDGRRAVRVLPRLGSLVPPATPREDDAAFTAAFGAFLDRQPDDADAEAIGAYARLALPATTDATRRVALSCGTIAAPRRLALIADALLAGADFGVLAAELRAAVADGLDLVGADAMAAALRPSVSVVSERNAAIARQAEAERLGLPAAILAPVFAREGAELAWDGAFDTDTIVDFSIPRSDAAMSISIVLDARDADPGVFRTTLAALSAQSHCAIEIIVVAGSGSCGSDADGDDRVSVLVDDIGGGAADAWNRALAVARGDLVAIAQCGEFWLVNALAAHVAARKGRSQAMLSRSFAIDIASGSADIAPNRRLRLSRFGIAVFDRRALTLFDRGVAAPLNEMAARIVAGHGVDVLVDLDAILSVAPSPPERRADREDRAAWSARHLAAMRAGVAPPSPAARPDEARPLVEPRVCLPSAAHEPESDLAAILGRERASDAAGVIAATEDGLALQPTAAGLRAALARIDALGRLGRGRAAIDALAAAEARHGASWRTRERAAALLTMFGDDEGALAALTEAVCALTPAADPGLRRALTTRRSEALIMLDRRAEARDAMFALIESGTPVHLELAAATRALETEADLARFERALQPSLAHAGGRARTALHNLAVASRKLGFGDRAIAAARRRLLHALDHAAYGERPAPPRGDWSADAALALGDAVADLAAIALRPFLISGTLLGHVREGGVLGHDKDIDLGVFTALPAADIRTALMRNGRFALRPIVNERFVQATHANGVVIDVFLHWRQGDRIYHQGIKSRWWNSPFELEPASFLGSDILVPTPADRYLIENYGPGWRTPEPDFETFVDTPNMEVDDEDHMTWYLLTRLHDYHLAGKPLQFRRIWDVLAPRLGPDPEIEAGVARILATIAALDLAGRAAPR